MSDQKSPEINALMTEGRVFPPSADWQAQAHAHDPDIYVRAAANPARVDYLYFVRTPDKVHHFFTASETLFCVKSLEYGYGGC